MKSLKLNQLNETQMKEVRGGTGMCGCGCSSAGSGGSPTMVNMAYNGAEGKSSANPIVYVSTDVTYSWQNGKFLCEASEFHNVG